MDNLITFNLLDIGIPSDCTKYVPLMLDDIDVFKLAEEENLISQYLDNYFRDKSIKDNLYTKNGDIAKFAEEVYLDNALEDKLLLVADKLTSYLETVLNTNEFNCYLKVKSVGKDETLKDIIAITVSIEDV